MKLYQPKYRDKRTGKIKKCKKWHLSFVDNLQIRRRLEGYRNRDATNNLGLMIDRLKGRGGELDAELQKWFSGLDKKIKDRIVKFGMVKNQRILKHMGKTLPGHLEDFYESLLVRRGKKHANCEKNQLKIIFDSCGFNCLSDIDANAIDTYLGRRLKDKEISQRTFNAYLKYARQFCRWLVNEQRIVDNPVAYLKTIEQPAKTRNRRAIKQDELERLLETTRTSATVLYGMTGHERFLIYVLACQTGMRAGDLRGLRVGDFDFENLSVTVRASCSKNRKEKTLPLKPNTAAILKDFLKNRLPNVRAFGGTYRQLTARTSEMLQADLAEAKIPYKDDKGRVFDFHSLRKEAATLLKLGGVSLKDAQTILRHSDISLTCNVYTETFTSDEVEAVGKLPDFAGKKFMAGA